MSLNTHLQIRSLRRAQIYSTFVDTLQNKKEKTLLWNILVVHRISCQEWLLHLSCILLKNSLISVF